MPYSSDLGKAEIRDWLRVLRPATILDVGAGSGTYSRLFRHVLPWSTWVAVEIHEPYVDRFQLKLHYDQVMVMDALDLEIGPGAFDVVLLGDVLEHLPEDQAGDLLIRAWDWAAKGLIVSVPLGDCPQGAVDGNEHEAHRSSWTYNEFREFAQMHVPPPATSAVRKDEAYKIGVFLWDKS